MNNYIPGATDLTVNLNWEYQRHRFAKKYGLVVTNLPGLPDWFVKGSGKQQCVEADIGLLQVVGLKNQT